KDYTVVIACPAVVLSPAALPNGFAGVAYDQTLVASGSSGPYIFSLAGGALPGGVSLSTGGILSGSPTNSGTFIFGGTPTNVYGCGGSYEYTVTIGICPAITVNPPTLPDGTFGIGYSQTLTATGGIGAYAFSAVPGSLPPGLNLQPSGLLSGTPTLPGSATF